MPLSSGTIQFDLVGEGNDEASEAMNDVLAQAITEMKTT
tara:strand:+ start:1336 stop:1452 length:117 start_codon:yes stop_codon:yes gene_type:complete